MPYVIGNNVNDRSSVYKAFDPPMDERTRAGLALGVLSPEELAALKASPPTLIIERPKISKVPDIIGWSIGPYILCPRLREILEDLEPGRHDFIPVPLITREPFQGRTDHGTYHILLPPPRIPALIIEETEFWGGFGREAYDQGNTALSPARTDPCVLDEAVISGHHLWRRMEDEDYFCSDELWRLIKAEKMKGWAVKRRCQVKRRE